MISGGDEDTVAQLANLNTVVELGIRKINLSTADELNAENDLGTQKTTKTRRKSGTNILFTAAHDIQSQQKKTQTITSESRTKQKG